MMKRNQYDVIVTDSSQRVSLELTRALGLMGLRVLNVERYALARNILASKSKYSAGYENVSDYLSDKFVELCNNSKAVFPVSTNTNISVYEKLFPLFPEKFLLPDRERFMKANYKPSAIEVSQELGIPCPRSELFENKLFPADYISKIKYPIVLKLADDENLFLEPYDRYGIACSQNEAEEHWNRLKVHGKRILIQEFIAGEGYGWSAIYGKGGVCLAEITHRRLREYPITGGPSSYCMVTKDNLIASYGKRILDHLKWKGPAMVEFKKDSKGNPIFIEINPRYWGSLPLARASGINMPYIHYLAIVGKSIPDYSCKEGTRLKFRCMDLMAGLQEFRKSKSKLAYAVKFIFEFMNPAIPDGIFSLMDPVPGIVYVRKNLLARF